MIGTAFGALLLLLFSSIPVAAGLLFLALLLGQLYSPMPLYRGLGDISWAVSSDLLLVAVPMYILLGEILLRSGMAERMYGAMARWLSWLPGGLMHANIGACMAFAATAGSSAATAATISTVSIPLIRRYGYNERLFLGSLASGGTLGILIPPSINMIVYGYLTETSVVKLYLAGFVPGFILGLLFMAAILIACLLRTGWGGAPIRATARGRLASLPHLLPPLMIFLLVVGSIYAGFATPTESASIGVVGALLLAAWYGQLTLPMLRDAVAGTMRTTGMVMLILLGAWFLNFTLSLIGLSDILTRFVIAQELSPFGTLMMVIAFYLVMGCFMESMPLMIISVPTFTP